MPEQTCGEIRMSRCVTLRTRFGPPFGSDPEVPTVGASPRDVRPVAPVERVDEDGFGLAAPGAAFVYRLVGLLPVRVENLAQMPAV